MLSTRYARSKDDTKMDLTPMIDVTFLILVFFMCTLKFKVLEGKLGAHLPKDVGVSPAEVPPVESIDLRLEVINPGRKVRVTGQADTVVPYTEADAHQGLRFSFDGSRDIDYVVAGRRYPTLEAVEARLRALLRVDPELPLELDAGEGIVQQDVVEALDLAHDLGVTEVRFSASAER